MVLDFANKWKTGQILKVKYLNGEDDLFEKVERNAKAWEQYANIRFDFESADEDSEIRIKFGEQSTDSKIGTDCLTEPATEPTMHYIGSTSNNLQENHIIHEFGHALGLVHEHLHPAFTIQWDKDEARKYYKRVYNYDDIMCDNNLFRKYLRNQCQYSDFDPKSIMMYPIPKEITTDESEFSENSNLSEADKELIGLIYPKQENHVIELNPDILTTGNITAFAQEDIYKINAVRQDRPRYYVNISGNTNVVLSFYKIEQDGPRAGFISYLTPTPDTPLYDKTAGIDAEIYQDLDVGEYYVRVRHFDANGKGQYNITLKVV